MTPTANPIPSTKPASSTPSTPPALPSMIPRLADSLGVTDYRDTEEASRLASLNAIQDTLGVPISDRFPFSPVNDDGTVTVRRALPATPSEIAVARGEALDPAREYSLEELQAINAGGQGDSPAPSASRPFSMEDLDELEAKVAESQRGQDSLARSRQLAARQARRDAMAGSRPPFDPSTAVLVEDSPRGAAASPSTPFDPSTAVPLDEKPERFYSAEEILALDPGTAIANADRLRLDPSREYTTDQLDKLEKHITPPPPLELTLNEVDALAVKTMDENFEIVPTIEEWRDYKQSKERLKQAGKLPGAMEITGKAIGGLLVTAGDAMTSAIFNPADSLARSSATLQTGIGRMALNVMEAGGWVTDAIQGAPRFRVEETGEFVSPNLRDASTLPELAPVYKEKGLTLRPTTEADIEEWEFQRFMDRRAIKAEHKVLGEKTAPTEFLTSVLTGRNQQETPNLAQATVVEIGTDPFNALPLGAGMRATGLARQAGVVSSKAAGIAEKIAGGTANVSEAAVNRFAKAIATRTGISTKNLKGWKAVAVGGGGSLGASFGLENMGILPDGTAATIASIGTGYALGLGVLRVVEKGAKTSRVILRETADASNGLDIVARQAVASNPAVPSTIRQFLEKPSTFVPVESTPARLAQNPELGKFTRFAMEGLSNPYIVQGARGAKAVAGGAVRGGSVNAPLALAADAAGEDQAAAGMIGTGAVLGGFGGGLSRFTAAPTRRQQAELSDIGRMLVDVELSGGDVSLLAKTTRTPDLSRIAAVQGFFREKVDYIPLGSDDFRLNAEAHGATGAAGFFVHAPEGGKAQMFVNLDAKRGVPEPHEFGHALLAGNALDPAQRAAVRDAVTVRYGEDGIRVRAEEYARNLIAAEKGTGRAGKPRSITPEELALKLDELEQTGLQNGDVNRFDWARDEIFAEEFARGIDWLNFANIRRNIRPGTNPLTIMENLLGAQARALEASGVRIDPQTGKPLDTAGTLFQKNPILAKDKAVLRNLEGYTLAYKDFINHPEHRKPRTTAISPRALPSDFANNPNVAWRDMGNGVLETEFARKDPASGRVEFKSDAEISALYRKRQQQTANLVGSRLLPDNDTNLGKRKRDGKIVITGKTLPEKFYSSNGFAPHIRDFAKQMQDASDSGSSLVVRYHALISRSDTGAIRIKDLGNLEAVNREIVPWGWTLTSKGNLNANVIDMTAFRNRVQKGINENNPALTSIYGNNARQIEADLRKLMENWKNNLPGESGLGTAKKNVLNSLLGLNTSVNKAPDINPVAGAFQGNGIVKQFRLDRVDNIAPTGRSGLFFDYGKANRNLLPDSPTPLPNLAADLD